MDPEIIVRLIVACFPVGFSIDWDTKSMCELHYKLVDKSSGEVWLVDEDTVERLVGVEISYIDLAIAGDGRFKNDKWCVAGSKTHSRTPWSWSALRT